MNRSHPGTVGLLVATLLTPCLAGRAAANPPAPLASSQFTFPGAAISIAVVAFNLLADGLRDVLEPRTR